MKKVYLLGLAGAAFFAGVYIQGCSGDSGTDGGSTTCHANSDCGTGQLCDTYAGQCVTSCTQGSDCPDTEKTCQAAVSPSVASGNYCQCSTDAVCGTGFVCSTVDHVCEQKCTSDSNCQGFAQARSCNTTTGQCVPATVDAGNPDSGGSSCVTTPSLCTADQHCNATSGACETGAACTTAESADGCAAGSACFAHDASGGTLYCEAVGNPANDGTGATCGAEAESTTPGSDPLVYDVTFQQTRGLTGSEDSSSCSTETVAQFKGYYSDPGNTLATGTTSATYAEIIEVTADNANAGNTYHNTSINADGTFTFEICTDNTSVIGVALKSGSHTSNSACIGSFQ